jgi:hypothetical protein
MTELPTAPGNIVESTRTPVEFLHYGDLTNIGDYLASPRHYFDFTCESPAVIVGGGASNNYFAKRAFRKSGVRVLWGVGQSWPFGTGPSPFGAVMKSMFRRLVYKRASTRDPSLVTSSLQLVPCVSVFNPITEIPPGQSVSVFVNGNPNVSGNVDVLRRQLAASGHDFEVYTNTLSIEDFTAAFARSRTIITNSYHAAYWGLLSGREVHIIGYSSKFTSLAELFGFNPDAIIRMSRGDGVSLAEGVARCANRVPMQLADARRVRRAFRQMNLDFADSIAEVGVVATLNSDCLRRLEN